MAGTLVIDNLTDGAGNSTSATAAIRGSAKAWVSFSGVTTVTIRGSYNISSVVRNSTGNYTVSFTNSLADANYAVVGTGSQSIGVYSAVVLMDNATAPTSGSFRITTSSFAATDSQYVNVAAFR